MAEVYFSSKKYTQTYPKLRIPSFDGFLNLEAFLYWIQTVDDFFDFTKVQRDEQEFLVARKLRGFAKYWWERFQNQRLYQGKKEIMSWKKMRVILFDRFYQFEEGEDDEIWADYSRDGDFYLQSAAQDIDKKDEELEIEVGTEFEANTVEAVVNDELLRVDEKSGDKVAVQREYSRVEEVDDIAIDEGGVEVVDEGADEVFKEADKKMEIEIVAGGIYGVGDSPFDDDVAAVDEGAEIKEDGADEAVKEEEWEPTFSLSNNSTLNLIDPSDIPMGQNSFVHSKPNISCMIPQIFAHPTKVSCATINFTPTDSISDSVNLGHNSLSPQAHLCSNQLSSHIPLISQIPYFSPSIPIPPKPNFTFIFYDPFLVDPIKKNENFSIYFLDFNFKRRIQRHPSPWILLFAPFSCLIALVPLWIWDEERRTFSIGVFFSSSGPNSRSSSFFFGVVV